MKSLVLIITLSLFTHASTALAYSVDQAKEDMTLGRYVTAIESLRQLVGEQPNNYEAWFLFGVAHVHEQQYHQAIEAFHQVISLRPTLAEPHNNLAAVYNNLGDTKSAVRELEIALEKRPNYTIAEENLADLYIKLALQHYRNTLQISPNPLIEQRYARLIQVRNPIADTVKTTVKQPAQPTPLAAPEKQVIKQPTATPKPAVVAKKEMAAVVITPKPLEISHPAKPAIIKPTAALLPTKQSITNVLDALEAWRLAWASQNLDAYFSAYADNYQPNTRFDSLQGWKKYKTRVIENKSFIRIEFEQVQINMVPNKHSATVMLLQRFHSNTYNGKDFKKITFKYTPQGWKITTEASIK